MKIYRCTECKKFHTKDNGRDTEICPNCGYINMRMIGINTARIYGYKGEEK